MKKTFALGCVMVLVAVLTAGQMVFAAEEEANEVKVTVTGKNYCIEKTLGTAGDSAKLGMDACRHALEVTEAKDADGAAIDAMEGWTLHYLCDEESKPLSSDKEYFGKKVEITGTVYKKQRVLDVESVEIKEDDVADLFGGGDDDNPFAQFDYSQGGGSASVKKK